MRALARLCGTATLGVYRFAVRLRDKAFSVAISGAFDAFGRNTVIQMPARLVGERRISLGSNIFIGAGSWLQALGDGRVEVGDGTSIAGGCVLSAATSVRLGRKVLIARNVYVSDHIHAYGNPERAVLDQGLTRLQPVVIEDGAWLGENVVVCPGVTIGRGAVIGANAVVREDVPPHAVAVGVPARVVSRFAGNRAIAAVPSA